MRSYLHAARKHHLPLPWLSGLLGTLAATLSRRTLTSAPHRSFTAGRFTGLWSARFGQK